MATDQVLHMNGGVGETSYAKNCSIHRKVLFKEKPILEGSVIRVYHNLVPKCLKVADLGCSSGSNTLFIVSEIMDAIHAASFSLNYQPPEFQFFLNDLVGNDFNTIFKLLPDFFKKLEMEKGKKFGSCFIAGVPGSFYRRLFPSNSMHFFHSSFGQHWLSQVPKGLTSGGLPLNKGNIYVTESSPPAVLRAYQEQFQEDFKLFLRLRSEELVRDGGMLLIFLGRVETNELLSPFGLVGMTLHDMVLEGIVEEPKLDSFDIPFYTPTPEEVRQIIDAEGSFTLQRIEVLKIGWDADMNESEEDNIEVFDNKMRAKFIANYMRACAEPLLTKQFGSAIMDELFLRFMNKVVQLLEVKRLEHNNLVLSMTKNL
ncbi:hypothetical protein L6164_037165 [Bauhinia variegata]|uniref:Uncharacterized protein n=1 Tax=Bauhinia variegata TaxID=167791 RepID=A0ACB9KJD6_BAUVA|nr:hypothetical protein L6164_037165 [Bauhinia variegata]